MPCYLRNMAAKRAQKMQQMQAGTSSMPSIWCLPYKYSADGVPLVANLPCQPICIWFSLARGRYTALRYAYSKQDSPRDACISGRSSLYIFTIVRDQPRRSPSCIWCFNLHSALFPPASWPPLSCPVLSHTCIPSTSSLLNRVSYHSLNLLKVNYCN